MMFLFPISTYGHGHINMNKTLANFRWHAFCLMGTQIVKYTRTRVCLDRHHARPKCRSNLRTWHAHQILRLYSAAEYTIAKCKKVEGVLRSSLGAVNDTYVRRRQSARGHGMGEIKRLSKKSVSD